MYIISFCLTRLLQPSLSPNVHCLPLSSSAVNDDLYLYSGVDQEDTFVCALGLYVFSTGMHHRWGASMIAMTFSISLQLLVSGSVVKQLAPPPKPRACQQFTGRAGLSCLVGFSMVKLRI